MLKVQFLDLYCFAKFKQVEEDKEVTTTPATPGCDIFYLGFS